MKLHIYLLALILFNVSSLPLRRLYSDDKLNQICSDAEIEFKSTNQTFSEYTKTFAQNSTDILNFFKKIITDYSEISDISDVPYELFLKKIGIYVFVIILSVFVLISWVCFGCCCCCGCCLFKKRGKKRSFLFIVTILGLFGLLIVLGISAVGLSPGFGRYLSGSVCSFFQVFNHTLEGDFKTSEESSRWVGLNKINNEFTEIFNEVDGIVGVLSNETTYFESNFTVYSGAIQELLNKEFNTTVRNPINNAENVTADYSIAYPELIKGISEQYSTIQDSFNSGINFIKSELSDLSSLDQQIDLTSINDTINTTSKSIISFRNKVSENIGVIYDNVSKNLLNSFKAVFGLFIAFAVIGLAIFVLHSFSQKCTCKCIVHLLWFGLLLFIVAGLIVGSILGIVGTIAGELISVLPYMLSEDFLTQVGLMDGTGDAPEIMSYIEVCLEGNGNFVSKLNFNFEIEGFETMINDAKATVSDFGIKIRNYSNIGELGNFTTLIQSYHDDYSLAFSNVKPDSFPQLLENLNSLFGDYNDVFAIKQTECPEDKTYLSPEKTRGEQGNYCLVIHEWTDEQIESMYPEATQLHTAFENLYNFIQDNNAMTKLMLHETQNMTNLFNNIIKSSLNFTRQVNNSIESIETFYNKNMGNDGAIVNKFNCGFIKDDVIIFIDQLFNGFASQAAKVGTVSILCSIIAYFAVIMLIVYINTKSDEDKLSSKNIERLIV